MQSLLYKIYDDDSIGDIERDIFEAIRESDILAGGTFRVDVVHDECRQTEEDWDE